MQTPVSVQVGAQRSNKKRYENDRWQGGRRGNACLECGSDCWEEVRGWGGGIKQGMRGQVKRGEVMAWAIITRYKNLAVTCAPFLCGATLLCYTVSLPLSSLKMPSSVFIRLSTAANFCKLSTFFGTVLLLWHILLFSGRTVFRNNHVIMLVSIKRQR